MELSIKPTQHNKYRLQALLIKGASPRYWFQEMEAMNLHVNEVEAYAIPSSVANVLYGCVIIFKHSTPTEYRNHKRLQCAHQKFLIPEHADLYPQLTIDDLNFFKSKWLIAHPDFGFVELESSIDWATILSPIETIEKQIVQPAESIYIPHQINSFSIEMDDDQLFDSLQANISEEEWMKDLPFNLQKVLSGNKREIEKYLKYLEQHPEHALALGVPLDVMSTSRSEGWGSFKFRESWMGSLFGGSGSRQTSNYGSNDTNPFWEKAKYGLLALSLFILTLRLCTISQNKEAQFDFRPIDNAVTNVAPPIVLPPSTNSEEVKGNDVSSINSTAGSNLEKAKTALLSKYMRANLEYAKKEIQADSRLKDSVRQQIEELSKQRKALNERIQKESNFLKSNEQALEKNSDSIAHQKENVQEHLEQSFPPFDESYSYSNREMESLPKTNLSNVIFIMIGLVALVLGYIKFIKQKQLGQMNALSGWAKLFLFATLIGMLVYILYPIISRYGYNWAAWLLFIASAVLMYRLFNAEKTILKSEKDE